jgi:predicted RNase H-like HicB family nuclease
MGFNTKTVSRIIGLSVRQLDYWDRTHLIKPSIQEAAGTGTSRIYSFNDLVQLKVAKTLLDKGISVQKIRKALHYLEKSIPRIEKPLSKLRFLTDGETIFVITAKEKEIVDTLRTGQIVIAIALGEIVEDLKGEISDIGSVRKYDVSVGGKKYPVKLHPDMEDGGYWVECPSLPGCASQGDTVAEALRMIRDAIEEHLHVEKQMQKRIKKAS